MKFLVFAFENVIYILHGHVFVMPAKYIVLIPQKAVKPTDLISLTHMFQ